VAKGGAYAKKDDIDPSLILGRYAAILRAMPNRLMPKLTFKVLRYVRLARSFQPVT